MKERFKNKSFKILAVNVGESAQTINAFLKKFPMLGFDHLLDSSGKAMKSWNVYGYPSNFLIDKNNNIRYAAFGAIDWSDIEVYSRIEEIMNEI